VGLAKRPWTEEDNARLKEFVAQDASIIRAAAALNRSTKNVRIQARKLGAPFPPMRVFRKKFAEAPRIPGATNSFYLSGSNEHHLAPWDPGTLGSGWRYVGAGTNVILSRSSFTLQPSQNLLMIVHAL
jgi:hypothetical protein